MHAVTLHLECHRPWSSNTAVLALYFSRPIIRRSFVLLFHRRVHAGLRRDLEAVGQVVQPRRLLQQMHSPQELLHRRLDTRVNNRTALGQVSCLGLWKVFDLRCLPPQ